MPLFSVDDIVKATGGALLQAGTPSVKITGVSHDTRATLGSTLFVAIPGPRFDGHTFVAEAARKGAVAALVSHVVAAPPSMALIKVEDTIRALGDLAHAWRQKFSVPCVAITGSNGKSTTKQMATAIASELGDVLATEGNFNNLIGLPLTLFRWRDHHRAAILEMGMNTPGEIQRLTEITRPTVGLITNVTAAHLERLGSVEAVARAKGELFDTMGKEAIAIINDEDPWAKKLGAAFRGRCIHYGMQNESDVRFCHMETPAFDTTTFTVAAKEKEVTITLPVMGVHNVLNAMAAIAIGEALGVDLERAAKRLQSFKPMAMRFEQIQLANGVRLIHDAYNANPESMTAALTTIATAKRAGRFIAVLGDMLELGAASAKLHRDVGTKAVQCGVDQLYAVGRFAAAMVDGARSAGMKNGQARAEQELDAVKDDVLGTLKTGDVILVKASRGMKFERLVEFLKREIGSG
ncbi:MAG: UDP-N-acetylmuramoyl-tripeptide--D-alanyl-D-alanine ligase [Deltaproteobacteria bacterium]|nr:UDP-N-acetylmuramoyl-tripeptide--D-alanyl-D-alanine ligase [Deltaproteobacteria bacterium]